MRSSMKLTVALQPTFTHHTQNNSVLSAKRSRYSKA
jgi:hypothetical protein